MLTLPRLSLPIYLHRWLIGVVLIGNLVVFAGFDPVTRVVTAALLLLLAVDMGRVPAMPRSHRLALAISAAVVVLHLLPLPAFARKLLQPGLADLIHTGWAPLSIAPWATLTTAASLAMAFILALGCARTAASRTGLPVLMGILLACCALLAVSGLASEASDPGKLLLFRTNITGSGDGAYGPYINRNLFAAGVELTLPAALALLAVALRHLSQPGASRRRASVLALGAALTASFAVAAVLRCGSRGGVVFLGAGLLLSIPLWMRVGRGPRWFWLLMLGALAAFSISLATTRLPLVTERFREMLAVEGAEGNDRWDLWAGTVRLGLTSPLLGTGAGSFRHAIGVTKPATADFVLEQAHNDWLEWIATTGVAGAVALGLGAVGLLLLLRPSRVRGLRFEYRYPHAAAGLALAAASLHAMTDAVLQSPANAYLYAAWVGLLWGLWESLQERERRQHTEAAGEEG